MPTPKIMTNGYMIIQIYQQISQGVYFCISEKNKLPTVAMTATAQEENSRFSRGSFFLEAIEFPPNWNIYVIITFYHSDYII